MEWFRMWHGTVNDGKLRVIARKTKTPMAFVVAIWHYLLDYASQHDNRGSIAGLDLEEMAITLDISEDQARSIIEALEERRHIQGGRLSRWEKRQPKREDSSADRVKKFREKKRSVTQCNADETQGNAPDTDTDTDKDKEEIKALAVSCFEETWKAYPERDGNKKKAGEKILRQLKTEEDIANLRLALKNYLRHVDLKRADNFPELRYKNRATWFNNWQDWIEWEEPAPSQQPPHKKNPLEGFKTEAQIEFERLQKGVGEVDGK